MNIYERYGVPTIVNAAGPKTWLGGSLMSDEVVAAMQEASRSFATIQELQAKASTVIAEITGAEAGYITSGAAAGLTLAAAACLAGLDPARMEALPETIGMRDEIILPRSHRNSYDHAIRASGAKIVEAGFDDIHAGVGTRRPESWELEAAITPNTAAIHAVASPTNHDFLAALIEMGHRHDLPVILDAAAQIPPKMNLRRFIDMGGDLVVFSGGKGIRGPQASGFVCGRADLIESVALQHLDLDVPLELWEPPSSLIRKERLTGLPRHGIGRGFKVGKEEIVGAVEALRLYWESDEDAFLRELAGRAEAMAFALSAVPGLRAAHLPPTDTRPLSLVEVTVSDEECGLTALELARRLRQEDPRVYVREEHTGSGRLVINPFCLQAGEEDVVVRRFEACITESDRG